MDSNHKLPSEYTRAELKSWKTMHIEAKLVTNQDQRQRFVDYIKYLYMNFPCGRCRNDIKRYMDRNQIPEVTDDKTIFEWSWKFHNDLNKKLNKPIMSWELALELYEKL
jgi:hypothetical protein